MTPRPSATVLLVREADPWELLLVQRPGGADFAPGAYVFPGGTIHADDHAWPDEIRAAAVRELFEEAGILLAAHAGDTECESVRRSVSQGTSFGNALKEVELEPDFESLLLLARWVTPARLRRRYDARFYLARLPPGQSVHPQEGEVTDWRWISPRRALDTPEVTLVYATRAVLESVAGFTTAESLFAYARALEEVPIVEPRMIQTESGWEVVRD